MKSQKKNKKNKPRKKIWFDWKFLLLILLIGGVYYQFYYLPSLPAVNGEDQPTLQTATVRQGDLIVIASGSGELIASQEVELGFGTSGTVAELHVQVGDEVRMGDILAIQGERTQLELALTESQLSIVDAQQALDDLFENADLVAAQAMLNLALAIEELNAAEYSWNVAQEDNRASQLTIEDALTSLLVAENRLEDASNEYNEVAHLSLTNQRRVRALDSYLAAQQAYSSASRLYNWYTGNPTEVDQDILDSTVALAEANVANAQLAYERVIDGPNSNEVAQAELQLANAQAQLAVSQSNLDASIIVAPMDGTILSLTADVGQNVSGSFITLADLRQLYLEIFLDETDLDKIEVGYDVEAIFDALPDRVFIGTVVQVDPFLTASGGASLIGGLVELDTENLAVIQTLPIGMAAAVDVIGGRAEGVVLVPVEALREISEGQYGVFVLEDGDPVMRVVRTGIQDLFFAEVLSGLEQGDVVTTGIVETK